MRNPRTPAVVARTSTQVQPSYYTPCSHCSRSCANCSREQSFESNCSRPQSCCLFLSDVALRLVHVRQLHAHRRPLGSRIAGGAGGQVLVFAQTKHKTRGSHRYCKARSSCVQNVRPSPARTRPYRNLLVGGQRLARHEPADARYPRRPGASLCAEGPPRREARPASISITA